MDQPLGGGHRRALCRIRVIVPDTEQGPAERFPVIHGHDQQRIPPRRPAVISRMRRPACRFLARHHGSGTGEADALAGARRRGRPRLPPGGCETGWVPAVPDIDSPLERRRPHGAGWVRSAGSTPGSPSGQCCAIRCPRAKNRCLPRHRWQLPFSVRGPVLVLDQDAVVDLGDARRGPGSGHRIVVLGPGMHRPGKGHHPVAGRLD